MNQETITHKRLWAWLSVAMSAPLAHFSGGSWVTLLILGILCWGIIGLLPECGEGVKNNRAVCAVEFIWFAVLLSQLLPLSASYWIGRKNEIVVPGVLLALGAYGCTKRASRTAGVLFWVLIVMYLPVAVAGAKDVRVQWLMPENLQISFWVIPVLLLPCGAGVLGVRKKDTNWYPGIVVFAAIVWALTAGVLSPAVAALLSNPFRELSRSLTIGAASRFESVLSVAVTLGWFGLFSLLIRCCSVMLSVFGIRQTLAPWLSAAAAFALYLLGVEISGLFGAIAAVIVWVLLPLLAEKNFSKKREKSA